MRSLKKVVLGTLLATAVLALAHAWLNFGVNPLQLMGLKKKAGAEQAKLRGGCRPVSDWIRKNTVGKGLFEPVRFHGWPELKEAHISGLTPATFMLAPMAIAL